MGHAELAAIFTTFVVASVFAAFFIPIIASAEEANETNNTTSQNVGISGNASILSLSPSVSELAITSGPQISTIDPVRTKVRLMNSFGSSWADGLTDVFDSYNITYTIKLQYCSAFAFGVCIWWSDFSPVKEKTYSNIVYVIKALTSAKLVVSKPDSYQVDYNYDPLNTQSTEAAENWAENLMNSLDDVVVGYLGTQDSGKTLALTVTVKGYAENNGKSVSDYNWNTVANSANNPLVVTVTNPPDPDIRYSGSRQYRLDGTWYGFSTPIKLKPGQSRNLDFYVTNIGGGPTSDEGYVSMSVENNLDISDRGGSYTSAPYPPGSQLSGKCSVPNSQYKLLDTWTKYTSSDSRYINTKLTGKSKGDGWVDVRAAFDTPATGMNTINDPRTGETSDQDQQCFPVYKIPVTVRDCFADSDCPADGDVGNYYCLNNDMYRKWRDYYCSASNACSYSEVDNPNIDCGDSYCDSWQDTYCQSGSQLWHKRNCYDKGCSSGACFSNSRIEDVKIQDCPGKTDPWGSLQCGGYTQIQHSRWIYDGICSGTPASCTYKAAREETEVVEQCNDYCDAWGANYCKAGGVYRNRTCHDKGCNTSDTKCYDNVWVQEEKVTDCAYGCDSGQCVACLNNDNCGGWEGTPECCHMEGVSRVCGNLNPLTDDSWQMRGACVSAGTKYSYCTKTYILKQKCNGTEYCDPWSANYCINNSVYQSRTCYKNYRCDNGYCGFTMSTTGQKIQDCPAGTACSNGTCVTTCTDECSAGQTRCNGNFRELCGNYDGDVCLEWPPNGTAGENCGQASYCSAGSCISCQQGTANCNQNSSDGCETSLMTNNSNCGSCGNACGPGQSCTNGSCSALPSCAATNTSCGIYPNCSVCSLSDGCSSNYYNYYFCASNAIGCSHIADDCSDCSCACSGYGANESAANGNCNDGKDNDCDGSTDSSDAKCRSRMAGDVNGDSRVDIFDLAAVGLAFGSQPGDANWNPNADLTGDGKIGILDLATVGLNYGMSVIP